MLMTIIKYIYNDMFDSLIWSEALIHSRKRRIIKMHVDILAITQVIAHDEVGAG